MLLGLLYLVVLGLLNLLLLPGRLSASKDIELLVLGHDVAVLRGATPTPRLDWADRVVFAAITATNPGGRWTTQQVRNLVMDLNDCVTQFRVPVRDRAGQFTASSDAVLADVGIRVARIPPRCPQANCFAGRFVRTLRAELTDPMLIFNRRRLCAVLAEYARHCDGRRPHRARGLHPPLPTHPVAGSGYERITCRPVLGGLINPTPKLDPSSSTRLQVAGIWHVQACRQCVTRRSLTPARRSAAGRYQPRRPDAVRGTTAADIGRMADVSQAPAGQDQSRSGCGATKKI